MRALVLRGVAATALVAIVLAGCSSEPTGEGDEPGDAGAQAEVPPGAETRVTSEGGGLVLETTSTRADMVTGGEVLVTVSGDAVGDELAVTVDGEDVTGSLAEVPGDDGARRGLVEVPAEAESTLEAAAGDESVSLTVVDHPTTGPVFSGPHLEPWACTTEALGLGEPTDDDCSAPTQVRWQYVTADGSVEPLDAPAEVPADAATVELDGEEVPFVVRQEQGTIDRGVYWIWVLDADPAAAEGADEGEGPAGWDAAAAGWNGRLVSLFGGGCGTQYSQGRTLATGLDTGLLADGYALVTNTLDTFQTSCNATLSAEAALMTRERFVEGYGVPELTLGAGGSGGAIQQLLIAQNQPGLLDGLAASAPFPDAVSIAQGVTDCGLLLSFYEAEVGPEVSPEQQAAINGQVSSGTCASWRELFLSGIDPTTGCALAEDEVYDPLENPEGARCTLQDSNVNVLGTDPDTGFALRPVHNVGVQYGYEALRDDVIDLDLFLELNERIGGYDPDGRIVDQRTAIDRAAADAAYRTGQITGPGPLLEVPIILLNPYTDALGDIHTRGHAFAIRDRLALDGEDDPGLALWTVGGGGSDVLDALVEGIDATAQVRAVDEWATALAETDPDLPIGERLAASRPDSAENRCTLPDGTEVTGGWEVYDEPGPCSEAYPVTGDPRTAAGGPQAGDTIACSLRPVDPDDYGHELDDEALARLEAIFPDGVCDWLNEGIGQQPPAGTWQDFGP